ISIYSLFSYILCYLFFVVFFFFFFQAEDGIRDDLVTGVQTCALPILLAFRRKRILAALQGAGGRGRRALPRVRPGRRISVCAGTQVHAVRRFARGALCAARSSRLFRSEERRVGEEARGQEVRDRDRAE